PGFADFDAPASFLKFNRALRARVAVYQDDFSTALTALGQSFLSTSASLDFGAYHTFGTGSGDALNAVYDPDARALHAHPSLRTDAQLQGVEDGPGESDQPHLQLNGARDQRFLDKTLDIASKTVQGITTDLIFNVYQSPTDPIPIIRNEELILLRAEANLGLGNLTTALADINFIRENSGGLPAYSGAVTASALRTELLYNKRYSLLWEGGHRWADMRHYGLLSQLPQDLTTHRRFLKFPFPINECTPRDPEPAGCTEEAGI
ncbi:MAG: RagB/SusD family nutrient uptake outer membrane protein, partial [Gemmatimonadetes bacterium]|nr:RagB/SusD family nutrient uptake outer membrane protein [Gemmatimonadota bacterium]